jgi:hypothetical protein
MLYIGTLANLVSVLVGKYLHDALARHPAKAYVATQVCNYTFIITLHIPNLSFYHEARYPAVIGTTNCVISAGEIGDASICHNMLPYM